MKVYVDIDDTRKITTYHDGLGTQQGLYVFGKDKIEILSADRWWKGNGGCAASDGLS